MRPRRLHILSALISTVAAAGWWALRAEPVVMIEPDAHSSSVEPTERTTSVSRDGAPPSPRHDRATAHPEPRLADPLARHRERLRGTASRLAARRAAAVASGAPAATVQALDAHLARTQEQLARLDAG
jgi:hypothetical protein